MDTQTLETNPPSPDPPIPQQTLDRHLPHPPPVDTLHGSMETHLPKTLETNSSSLDSTLPQQTLDVSSQSSMETHLSETIVTKSPSLDSINSEQTLLDGSSPITSPPPPPPVQTLDGSSPSSDVESLTGSSSEFSHLDTLDDVRINHSSPFHFGYFPPPHALIRDDCPSYSLLDEDDNIEEEEDDPSPLPLVKYSDHLSNYSYPHLPMRQWPYRTFVAETKSPYDVTEVEPSMVGAGLANLGNTCFLNAVLQCFTHTVPLVQGLRSLHHANPFDCRNEDFCVLCALREHVELSLSFSGRVVSPWKLVNNLSYISDDFRRFQQEDAHEFLQRLLERLGDSCPDRKTEVNSIVSQDDNLVNHIFGGRLISKLRCCNCGHCSDTYEPLIDLSLEIEDVDNLVSALQSFTKVEKMEDPESKFTCESCKKQVSGEKQLMLDSAPSVAAFHLKRFKNDGVFVEKIDKYVEYPLELDLKPFTSCNQEDNVQLKYELYAVVVHAGSSSTSGHYFCFVRSSPDTWHKLDDSKVFIVQESRVLGQDAYILFYARQGTPWFSSLMEANKACLDQNMLNTSPKSVLENVENVSSTFPVTENIYTCKVHEISDAMEGMSTEFCSGSRHIYTCKVHEISDAMEGMSTEFCSGSRHGGDMVNEDMVEVNETRDNASRIYTRTPLGVSDSCDGTSSNFEKSCNESPFSERSCDQINEVSKDDILPQTPPRSSSPDIYSKESPEVVFQIPRDHLRTVNKLSCKKPLDKALEDSKKKEALRYIKRTMPMSRSAKFVAAMRGSPGKKNKRRNSSSPYSKDSPNAHRKQSHRNDMRPVSAAISN